MKGLKQFFKNFNSKRKQSVWGLLAPTLLGVLVCVICLVGSTYAWFTSGVESGSQEIPAAHFDATIKTGGYTYNSGEKLEWTQDGSYEFEITPTGTASKGYCTITVKVDNTTTTYYATFEKGDGYKTEKFWLALLDMSTTPEVTFNATWGALPSNISGWEKLTVA